MHKALLIGCGSIGARYDLYTNNVQTHAKAYSLDKSINLDIFDPNHQNSEEVATRYNFDLIVNYNIIEFSKYDLVSICSPTDTHVDLLKKCFEGNVNVVLCEKPISYSIEDLESIRILYTNSNTKVIVNYIRRFQPKYEQLKKIISTLLKQDDLYKIEVRYCRGFLNNCSHAFDLIEYLFNKEIILDNLKINKKAYDTFPQDPTISLDANWKECALSVFGIEKFKIPIFEINLCFSRHKINILKSGDEVEIVSLDENTKNSNLFSGNNILKLSDCIKDYMIPVFDKFKTSLLNKTESDNFLNSVQLNLKMLGYMNA